MVKRVALAAAYVVVLCAGCVTPPPPRDPLAGIDFSSPDPVFKNLTVGLLLSAGSRDSIGVVENWNHQYFGQGKLPTVQSAADAYAEFLRKIFKGVARLERADDAGARRVDVVAILDLHYDKFAYSRFESASVTVKTVLLSPSGKHIVEYAESASSPSKGEYNLAYYTRLVREALGGVEKRIPDSPELAEYARTAGAAAAAAPAAPAEREPFSDVDVPSYSSPEAPENFALVIGVDKYQNLPRAEFAERDARAVKKHLLALGYPARNVVTLLGAQATKTGIEKHVETWLPRNTGPDSRVLVYFSGHGSPDVNTGHAYLVPWDGDVKYLTETGYPLSKLYEKLNHLKARQVIVAMDSCFSGAGGRSLLPRGARPLVSRIETGGAGRVVALTASAADEISGVDEKNGHGLFTYYFLKGLDLKRGQATVRDLYSFLRPKVQDAARGDNREQTPQLQAAGDVDSTLR